MKHGYEYEMVLSDAHGALARVLLAFSRRRARIVAMVLEARGEQATLSLTAECRDGATAIDIRRQIARMVEVVSVEGRPGLAAAPPLAAG